MNMNSLSLKFTLLITFYQSMLVTLTLHCLLVTASNMYVQSYCYKDFTEFNPIKRS